MNKFKVGDHVLVRGIGTNPEKGVVGEVVDRGTEGRAVFVAITSELNPEEDFISDGYGWHRAEELTPAPSA